MIKGTIKVNSYLGSAFIYRLQDSIRIKDAKIYSLKEVIVNNKIIIEKKTSFIKWLKIGLISIGVVLLLLVVFKILDLFK